jgi:MtaA/CmuA family methyltransferase
MNGYQRIMAAFHGERPDTVPVMLHNFMMAAREAGFTMAQFRGNPEAIAKSFIDAIDRYRYDGIVIDIDTATLAGAAGVPVDFPDDEPARVRGARLQSLDEVADLKPVDIAGYHGVQIWLEAVTRLKHHFGDEVLIRGNCDQCPFTLASMIRGMDEWLMDLLDPDRYEHALALLEYATGITLQFIRLMTGTGCHMVSNGDSVAGPELVSPRIYRTFALPYAKRVVDAAHSEGLPYVLHICGNTAAIIDDMVLTGADGLELDYKTDSVLARDHLATHCAFIGNIDPSGVLALGTAEMVEMRTRDLLRVFANTPRFVLNAGCAIPPTTPSQNLEAMIRVARTFHHSF